ncbi:hypothetical protein J5N97_023251 [Dioscorea zingiberensis]|uniref:DNA mismatch repair proteins mutS family domain-containing protein n=1 Tax=Dioscorea zingiberensis TaxID=325984 RepID=A0A9D5CCF3_9LILI|nr:hypothetical protein J5N97_023251 [Dioscorea zingiberensis]
MHRLVANSIMLHSPRWLLNSFLRRRPALPRRFFTSPLPQLVERKYYLKSHRTMKGIPKATRRLKSHNKDLCEDTSHSHILWWKEVGDFYEAIGFDACVLVEHAGLNPFGGLRSDSIPRAGCPVVEYHDQQKGYCMISVLEMMKTFSAEDGLTEEAIVTKLLALVAYHHLFLHTPLRHNSSGTSRWGEFGEGGLLWGECNGKSFEWFDGIPVEELLCKVRDIYGMDDEAAFRNVTISSEKRPQPLYLGTATQIGVIATEGIPSLLKVLLPSNYVGLPVLYIRDLLLNPPAYETASAIQVGPTNLELFLAEACRLMSNVSCSIPDFTCISAAKLVKLLESKEANHIEFCRINHVVDDILQMNRNSELSKILHVLLEPTWAATGLQVNYEIMVHESGWISHRIDEIISRNDEKGQEISSFELIPQDFFEDMESSWKGRVKRIHAVEAFEEVDKAAKALSIAIREDFLPIVSRVKSVMSSFGGPKGEICYARDHEAVWFKGKRFMPSVWANTPGEEEMKQLKPATDSKGKRYHEACEKARNKVLELLRGLSAELQNKINILVFSSMLLVIAKALSGHGKETMESINRMELRGLSPYWFDASQGNAIKNNVEMQSVFLLTGPNGGGKSSLLRSICAAALLGICGLMVPADLAVIPHFDSVMLHMKAYDSPADGKSSFQVDYAETRMSLIYALHNLLPCESSVFAHIARLCKRYIIQIEMSEIRSIVMAATSRSLVLVDEICRGTETGKGTCIAGSIIENLDHIGCLGIVSTHLHGIFDLPLVVKNVVYKAMGSEILDGVVRPTWKLIDGDAEESLALRLLREKTDDLVGRVRAHRSKDGMQNATFIYIVVPGKSIASQLETLLIHQLPRQGFRLVNKADGLEMNEFQKRRQMQSQQQHPGCMGRMINMFDLNAGMPRTKLLTDRAHRDASPTRRNQSNLVNKALDPVGVPIRDKSMVKELKKSSSDKKSCGTPMKMLIAQEMSKETESTQKPPGVVAKLMGLDALPAQQLLPLRQKSLREGFLHNASEDVSSLLTSKSLSHAHAKEYKDVYEVRQQPPRVNCIRDQRQWREGLMTIQMRRGWLLFAKNSQKQKRLATDKKFSSV